MGTQKHAREDSADGILEWSSNKWELTGFLQRFKDWLKILGAAPYKEIHSPSSMMQKPHNDGNNNFK